MEDSEHSFDEEQMVETEESLARKVEELERKNRILEQENRLFENHLFRHDPALLEETDTREDLRKPRYFSKRKDAARSKKSLLKPEQKYEIATLEMEEIRKAIDHAKATAKKIEEGLTAAMEEADQEIKDLKKEEYEFRRDIVQGAVHPRTGKVLAEKIPRYFEERLRARDALIEKLRLQNTSMRVKVKKAKQQLTQKEEMGEVLHAIDFEQLQIENKQYQEKIDERNKELLRLKVTSGNTVQVLNEEKKKLARFLDESAYLTRNIDQRKDQLMKIDIESNRVDMELEKAAVINRKLKEQREEYKVPGVMEYVKQKALVGELEKKVKDWNRKCEIAEMSLARERRLLRAAKRGRGSVMSSRASSASGSRRAREFGLHAQGML